MTTIQIPWKILDLIYTRHAQSERCRDRHGFIEAIPQNFIKLGCKKCEPTDKENVFKATYIYNDGLDLTLIIDSITGEVITNYLEIANNKGLYKGRFRITYQYATNRKR